jgi:hypothetical protein
MTMGAVSVPVIALAALAAGPSWQNVGVLGGVSLVALETTADAPSVTESTA